MNQIKTKDFEKMLNKGHSHAKKHNLTQKDLKDAIKRVRQK
jgi:DNA polymerase III sliding clamp (beta) subunit (PCNA family)